MRVPRPGQRPKREGKKESANIFDGLRKPQKNRAAVGRAKKSMREEMSPIGTAALRTYFLQYLQIKERKTCRTKMKLRIPILAYDDTSCT